MTPDLFDTWMDELPAEPLVYVCREIPGEHAGGPDCFCSPQAFTADQLYAGLPPAYDEVS